MNDHSPIQQYFREDDERFYATFPQAMVAQVPPQWHLQPPHDQNQTPFGSAAFYYSQPAAEQYPCQGLSYVYSDQYAYSEPSPSLNSAVSYNQSDATVPQPYLSNDSELAHAQDELYVPSVMPDFASSSESPENVAYSPIEETHHQLYPAPPQYLPQVGSPLDPSTSALSSPTPPIAAESPEDLSSPDSKPSLKRRRRRDDFGIPNSYPGESPRSYSVYKIPLSKPPQPPVQKVTKNRNAAQGEKKSLALACFFCRGRKIACGPQDPNSPDRTCNQCFRRSLKCEYPTESRRGMRKKKTVPDNVRMPTLADQSVSPTDNLPRP